MIYFLSYSPNISHHLLTSFQFYNFIQLCPTPSTTLTNIGNQDPAIAPSTSFNNQPILQRILESIPHGENLASSLLQQFYGRALFFKSATIYSCQPQPLLSKYVYLTKPSSQQPREEKVQYSEPARYDSGSSQRRYENVGMNTDRYSNRDE